MPETRGELRAADGVRLAFRSWGVDAPIAALAVSHGLGEHGGRYAALAAALAGEGIAVHALDHRGHGLSGGRRGHAARFADFVRDLEAFRAHLASADPDVPLFLLGHSLGGLIAIRHLQAHPDAWRGAVLSAPLLGVAVKVPRWKRALSGVLSRWIPALPFHSEVDPSALSSAPGYLETYRTDPLLHTVVTPRLYTEFTGAMGEAFGEIGSIRTPLLVVAPTDDRVVLPAAVARWAAACPGEVQVRRYEGFRHEALNEADSARVVADVARWIREQAG